MAGGNVLGLYALQLDGTSSGIVPEVHLFNLGYQPVTNSYPAASTGQYPAHWLILMTVHICLGRQDR